LTLTSSLCLTNSLYIAYLQNITFAAASPELLQANCQKGCGHCTVPCATPLPQKIIDCIHQREGLCVDIAQRLLPHLSRRLLTVVCPYTLCSPSHPMWHCFYGRGRDGVNWRSCAGGNIARKQFGRKKVNEDSIWLQVPGTSTGDTCRTHLLGRHIALLACYLKDVLCQQSRHVATWSQLQIYSFVISCFRW